MNSITVSEKGGALKRLAWMFLSLMILPGRLRAENVLLISVDTLRADRLSCYGYQRSRTPEIDRWAAEGIRFEQAYTEYPLTLPAHSTLLTGLFPFRHGVRENVGYTLGKENLTLAEVLKGGGYDTAGFIGSYVLAARFGIAQGFDLFDEEFGIPFEKAQAATALRRPAEEVADRYLAWAGKHRTARTFAFVHFYDPHAPCPEGYDAEVSRVDRAIGRINAALGKWGLLEKTHIVFLSDHGESLGEHGESGHGFFLYDSTLRVPLIIRPAAGFRFSRKLPSQQVSLADVMPTILQMVGVQSSSPMQGRSLVPAMQSMQSADTGLYAETFVPQLQFGWSPLRSFRLGRYALIEAPRPELYDVVADPGQTVNLLPHNGQLAKRYGSLLREFVAKHKAPVSFRADARVPADVREKLTSLGYVGPAGSGARGDFGRGVDPKDRIAVYESYYGVLDDIGRRNITPALFGRIDAIRKQAPELRGTFLLDAQALEGLGRLQDAEAAYRKALAQGPGNNVARAGLANVLARLGRSGEAESEFKRVLANDPGDYRSRNNLAGLYAARGDTDGALAELKKALASEPAYIAGWLNLGRLWGQRRNWRESESALRRAVALDDREARAHFLLSQALRNLGKTAEAEEHLRMALRLDPSLARR